MSYLFGYKINKDDKCGFPENVYNKVVNTLNNKKINYEIIIKDENPISKKFKKINNYNNILDKALKYVDIKKRVDRVLSIINDIEDINKLEHIIKVLENEI